MSTPSGRRLSQIRVNEVNGPCASLVLSLQAMLEAYGRRVELWELAAVTGNAFMVTYAPGASPRERWNMYGRHAFLEGAAHTYGLTLRELHPPSAAPVPNTPPEFAGHFRDSYLPFVELAISRDEPVLAWMGWPPPQESIWGVITGIDAATRHCHGQTMYSRGKSVPLQGPAVQVYIVQEYSPAPAVPLSIDAVLERGAIVLNNRLDASFGVVTGPAAIRKWREALTSRGDLRDDAALPCSLHLQMTQAVVGARQAAIRFFHSRRSVASPAQHRVMDAYISLFHEMIELLKPFTDEEAVLLESESEQRRAELAEALGLVAAIEERAAAVARP
ncbi:MAG TPA: hypothetical protein VMV94_07900 [Phycisphaerae bacterium]|nr:hypothetical protein [Phycisphaerae bacterium]